MRTAVERDLRLLKGYAIVSSLVIAVLVLGAFTTHREPSGSSELRAAHAKFDVVDAERVNIVEPNGLYRLVLSSGARSQDPLYKGRPFLYTGRHRPGIIFFNDEGTEDGGLTISGHRDSLGHVSAVGHLSFDQYNQDQVFVIQYAERNGMRRVGVQINDRHDVDINDWSVERDSINRLPDGSARAAALRRLNEGAPGDRRVAERVWVGRDTSKNAVVNLSDRAGKPRLRLVVDSLGAARIEFLDAAGRVMRALTGS